MLRKVIKRAEFPVGETELPIAIGLQFLTSNFSKQYLQVESMLILLKDEGNLLNTVNSKSIDLDLKELLLNIKIT